MRAFRNAFLILLLAQTSLQACRTLGTYNDQRTPKDSPLPAPTPPRVETLDVLAQFAVQSSQILATLDGALRAPFELKKQIQLVVPNIDARPSSQIKNPFDLILKVLQETGIPKLVIPENEPARWRWESLSGKRYFGSPIFLSLSPDDPRKNLIMEIQFANSPQTYAIAQLSPQQDGLTLLNLNELHRLYLDLRQVKNQIPIFELKGLFHVTAQSDEWSIATDSFAWKNSDVSLEAQQLSASFLYPTLKLKSIEIKATVEFRDSSKGRKILTLKANQSSPKGMELNFVVE